MKRALLATLVLSVSTLTLAQTSTPPELQDITPAQLQSVLSLPLAQAVKERETYKQPLNAAYTHQLALIDKDCEAESQQGQQPYNICMGHAEEQAFTDFAAFYNNLQMLCHDQAQLSTLQSSQKTWHTYEDSAMAAEHAAWPDGTGAPGFAAQVHLSLVRDRMRELHEIYGLNIAQ